MNFLVTGGAGFIGSNIVDKLLELGHSVRILDNFSTGRRENLKSSYKDIDLIEGDLRSFHNVERAVRDIEVILHLGALPSVPRSIYDPITTNEVNVVGTLNVLEAARNANVNRIVFSSSSSVYGNNPQLPKVETMITNPLSPYAVSKLTGENYCRVFSSIYGMEVICLRYFNVFGPRQNPDSQYSAVIPKFIQSIMNDESPVIYGDGTQSRDFTYIENVINANLLASQCTYETGLTMNCACHERITLNDLVDKINADLGKKVKALYEDPRKGDIKHSFADIDLAKSKIGYEPKVNFEEGLKKTINSFKEILV
ncbi:SDR family oxidoreductase [soil metagenome]